MGRISQYGTELDALDNARWPEYLAERSGLPGPRGNIELAQAVADRGKPRQFDEFIASGDEYLVFCGVVGLGRVLAENATPASGVESRLRRHATDDRWRVREAVAMALQRLGDADPPRLFDLVADWVGDPHPLVRRAAVAGICEPRLLVTAEAAAHAVDACELVTALLAAAPAAERSEPEMRSLRQALGYCWSVAVAADPAAGLPRFLALAAVGDRDVAWIDRENRKKARLSKLL